MVLLSPEKEKVFKGEQAMKLTSGFNFENYEITDYLGFCSGEYALNTKFLSDFNLLSSYSEKLEAAQKMLSTF